MKVEEQMDCTRTLMGGPWSSRHLYDNIDQGSRLRHLPVKSGSLGFIRGDSGSDYRRQQLLPKDDLLADINDEVSD